MNWLKYFIIILLTILFTNQTFATTNDGRSFFDMGVFAFEDSDFLGAEENFKKALNFDSENPLFNQYMGKTYLKQEEFGKADKFLNKAWNSNRNLPELKYDMATLKYKLSHYSDARTLFVEIVKEDPENILAIYYAALCFFMQKQYKQALNYFLKAAKNPGIKIQSYYYAALCNYKTDNISKAMELINFVKENGTGEIKDQACYWIKLLKKKKQGIENLSLNFSIGYQYDDNVAAGPPGTEVTDSLSELFLNAEYRLINKNKFKLGIEFIQYQTRYFNLNENDIMTRALILNTTYEFNKNFSYGITYSPKYFWVDNKSYISLHDISNFLLWRVDNTQSFYFLYKYSQGNNFENRDVDGHVNNLAISWLYYPQKNKFYLYANLGAFVKSASYENQFEELTSSAGVKFNIFNKTDLNIGAEIFHKEFEKDFLTTGENRKDFKWAGNLSFNTKITDWLTGSFKYRYIKRDSNDNQFDYRRNIISFNLSYEF